MEEMRIEQLELDQIEPFLNIIREIAIWLKEHDKEMWNLEKLTKERFKERHHDAKYHVCYVNHQQAAAFMLKEENPKFWPDVPVGESLYLKTLGVRRMYAGTGLSTSIINWVKDEARKRGKHYVRLEVFDRVEFLNQFYSEHGFNKVCVIEMQNGNKVGLFECEL